MTSAIPFPVLTARLIIRPMQLADAAGLFEVYGDADLMQHLTTDVPKNLAQAEEWVQGKMDLFQAQGGLSLWTVLERETGRVVGDAGLSGRTAAPVRSWDWVAGGPAPSGIAGWLWKPRKRAMMLGFGTWTWTRSGPRPVPATWLRNDSWTGSGCGAVVPTSTVGRSM